MNPSKRRTRPLGTSPDFCCCQANRLYVPLRAFDGMAFLGMRQDICFEYADKAVAERAQESIERRLTDCSDHWSATLSNEYSNFNVLEFLRRFLEQDGLQHMQWTGRVQLSSVSLECLLPDGIWDGMHVEDLIHCTIDWQQLAPDPANGSGGNTLPHRLHSLSPQYAWGAVTGISRPISATHFFDL